MIFDLWPDFQGHVKWNLCSVLFQRLKVRNFGIFAGDMARFVGRGRRAQNKRSIPLESWRLGDSRNVFFWKFTCALFWKCWFCKIRHLFRCASATGLYDTGGIRTNRTYMKRFLTSCSVTRAWLRSRASLGLSRATHSIRARWMTAARVPLVPPPLAHAKSTLSPS